MCAPARSWAVWQPYMPQSNNSIITFDAAKAAMAQAIRAYVPSSGITRIEFKIKPIDQLDWLRAQASPVKIFGANQEDQAAIAGVGEAAGERGQGNVSYAKILPRLRKQLSPQYPYLQWYGGFGFDAAKQGAEWKAFGTWRFVIPQFELARDGDKMIFCCNLTRGSNILKIVRELNALRKKPEGRAAKADLKGRKDQPGMSAWQSAVSRVLAMIERGACQKVVLARRTVFTFADALDPWLLLKTLKKVTPRSYHFAFQFEGTTFVGASPERLYKRQGRKLWSEALAGTKPQTAPGTALLLSAKDRLEHQLVVDAIVDGLKPLCRSLEAEKTPSVRTLSNGHHLNTAIQGHLKDSVTDEDILQSLHPTPALGGVPRQTALHTIRHLEPFARGWYAGPLGFVGFDWAEFVVGIRSGLVRGRNLSIYAGAGIVPGSTPDGEWQEVENKIGNFLKIIR